MTASNQTLELARHLGTKPEFMVSLDPAYYQTLTPPLTTVDDQVTQFKADLSAWLTANNEWGNLHLVSEMGYMAVVLLSCDRPVADKLIQSGLKGVAFVQEWIEK